MTKSKVVCKCYNITEQDIHMQINSGISSFKELKKETKIGKKCSSCKSKNKKRFKKYLEREV